MKLYNKTRQNRRLIICINLFLLISLALYISCMQDISPDRPKTPVSRIISLSPAITDIITDLGFEDNLVGITQYCHTTDNAGKTIVGTLLDINFEQVYLLRPDIIFLTPYHSALFPKLDELSVNYHSISLENIDEVKTGLVQIGNILNAQAPAQKLIQRINDTIAYYGELSVQYPKRSVILIVGRDEGKISSFYAVGRGSFLNEIIENLNCTNPLSAYIPSYPLISREELYNINPDIIIELYADRILSDKEAEQRMRDWNLLQTLNAVKNNRVYLINRTYIVRPGPKIIDIIKEIYNKINCEETI